MPNSTPHDRPERALQRLQLLLDLSRAAHDLPEDAVIRVASRTAREALGYEIVAYNAYRAAYDDYEVVHTLGSDELRRTLLGTSSPRSAWEARCFKPEDEVRPGIYFAPAERVEPWEDVAPVYVPELPIADDPTRWHPLDSLLVRIDSADGAPIGAFSIDVPTSGLRPRGDDLILLSAVRDHVSLALERTRSAAAVERSRSELAQLLETSAKLAAAQTAGEVHRLLTDAPAGLGFERAALYHRAALDTLDVVAVAGAWPPDATLALHRPLSIAAALRLLDRSPRTHGCYRTTPEELRRPDGDTEAVALTSRRCGRGARAWIGDVLLVPMRDDAGALTGLLAVEDPVDHLLPSRERLQALGLLATQAQAALAELQRRDDQQYAAAHDPLTGLANRRALDAAVARSPTPAVLIFGLDRVARLNHELGHEVGDAVLQRFARVLLDHAGEADTVLRLGGTEFCMVVPQVEQVGAVALAERVRHSTAAAMEELVTGTTVSVGVATGAPGGAPTRGALLGAADLALQAAKARGRNTVVAAAPVG